MIRSCAFFFLRLLFVRIHGLLRMVGCECRWPSGMKFLLSCGMYGSFTESGYILTPSHVDAAGVFTSSLSGLSRRNRLGGWCGMDCVVAAVAYVLHKATHCLLSSHAR